MASGEFFCPKCGAPHQAAEKPLFCTRCQYTFSSEFFKTIGVSPTPPLQDSSTSQPPAVVESVDIDPISRSIEPYPSYPYTTSLSGIPRPKRWNILAGMLIPIASYLIIVIFAIILIVFAALFNLQGNFMLFFSILSIFFFIVPYIWMQRYYPGKLTFSQKIAELGLPLRKYTGKELGREVLIGVLFGFGGVLLVWGLQIIAQWLVYLFYHIDIAIILEDDLVSQFQLDLPEGIGGLLLLIFTMFALVAIPEEILFRGFVQRSFESRLNRPTALVLTAFYFGIIHILQFLIFPPVFLYFALQYFGISVVLGLLRNWRRDLFAAVVMHGIYNISITLIVFIILA